jgi:BTB/POZ domain/BTB And C-terminal Kelch
MAQEALVTQLEAAWEKRSTKEISDCDVVFRVRERCGEDAHKTKELAVDHFVLSLRSPVFEAMISHRWKTQKENVVDVTGDELIDAESLTRFFQFLYTTSCDFNGFTDTFFRLVYLASKYDVPSLTALCEERFLKESASDDVMRCWDWLVTLKDAASSLRQHCILLAASDPERVFEPICLNNVPPSTMCDILEDDDVVCDELRLFHWAKAWVEQAQPDATDAERVMSRIRYGCIPGDALVTDIRKSGLAPPSLYLAALEATYLDDAVNELPHVDSLQFLERTLWDTARMGVNLERNGNTLSCQKKRPNGSAPNAAVARHEEREGESRVTWEIEFSGLKDAGATEKACAWVYFGVSPDWDKFLADTAFSSKMPWPGATGTSSRVGGSNVKSATAILDCGARTLRIDFDTGEAVTYDDVVFPCRFGAVLDRQGNGMCIKSRQVKNK